MKNKIRQKTVKKMVVIYDGIFGGGKSGISGVMAPFLGLDLLFETGGQTYAFEEVSSWLKETGFSNHRRINLQKAPGFSLILGTKPNINDLAQPNLQKTGPDKFLTTDRKFIYKTMSKFSYPYIPSKPDERYPNEMLEMSV